MASVQLCSALAGLAEGIDLRLFPSAYKALERELGLSPKTLGKLNMIGGLASCGTMVVWGVLADSCNRKRLFVASLATIGIVTLLMSMASSFAAFAFCRVASGVFSAALFPVTQSMVSEVVPSDGRGAAFSLLAFASSMSSAISAQLSARLHWRNAYAAMGSVTLVLACYVQVLMPDLDRDVPRPSAALSCSEQLVEQRQKVRTVFSSPTFLALLFGGIVGCVPWSALSFSMMLFEGMGFTATQASDFVACEGLGKAVGNIMGGRLGDLFSRRFPRHGRAFMAQVSIATEMVACLAILAWIPQSSAYFYAFAAMHLLFGVLAGPINPGVDRPLWAELVDQSCRGTIVAWWTFIAGSFGAVGGAPIVGWLAEAVLGYRPGKQGSVEGAGNTRALASAMLLCTMVPWAICFGCYSAIHCTYRRDLEKAASAVEMRKVPPNVLGAAGTGEGGEQDVLPEVGKDEEELELLSGGRPEARTQPC